MSDPIYYELTDINTILLAEYRRMGGSCQLRVNKDYFNRNILRWCEQTSAMESDNNPVAQNPNSTAFGYYQFTKPALKTAANRLKRYKDLSAMTQKRCDEMHLDYYDLTFQTCLLLANIFQQKGTDQYLAKIANDCDIQASRELYKRFHHTAPDQQTLNRLEGFYAKN